MFTARSYLNRGSRKNLKPRPELIRKPDKKSRRLSFVTWFACYFTLILFAITVDLISFNPDDTILDTRLFSLIIIIIAIIWFWSGWRYRAYSYELTDKQINIYFGIVIKQVRAIPYEMIEDVHISSSLLSRSLGLVHLWMKTDKIIITKSRLGYVGELLVWVFGAGLTETSWIRISGLSQDQAMKLKAELLSKAKNIATQATQRN